MKEKLAKLVDVKSIITVIFTLVMAYLALCGRVNIEQIYLMIVAFYFGTQHEKKAGNQV